MTPSALRRMLLVVALAVLGGCTAIPRAGPSDTAITDRSADLAGFTLVDMVAENVGDYRVQHAGDSAGTAGVPAAPPVALSSGDIIKVKISESKEGGIFAPLSTGGTLFDNVRVDHKGTISLPYAGRVPVAGLDPQRVEDRIRSRLAGVTFEPQVYVELISGRGSSVLIAGEVKSPGRFSMIEGPMTLIDAIAKAGGPNKPPHQIDVLIRRGKSVTRIPMTRVQSGQNQSLRAGDEVILETNAKVFNAMGAVKNTGQLEFPKSNPSLIDALSLTGGLDNKTSNSTGVFVFRLREPKAWVDADGKWQEGPVIFKFNMSKPEMMFIAEAFGIRPNDTIFVTNAPAVEWTRALAPIAITLSTLRGTIAFGDGL